MTHEQMLDMIGKLVVSAIEMEREACAMMVEQIAVIDEARVDPATFSHTLADLIRSRPKPTTPFPTIGSITGFMQRAPS